MILQERNRTVTAPASFNGSVQTMPDSAVGPQLSAREPATSAREESIDAGDDYDYPGLRHHFSSRRRAREVGRPR